MLQAQRERLIERLRGEHDSDQQELLRAELRGLHQKLAELYERRFPVLP